MTYAAALLVGMAIVGGSEWSTDEASFAMMTLIIAGAALGWLRPRLFALSGAAVGLVVPAIALACWLTGARPAYESATEAASHGPRYVASLLTLVIPALIGAGVGKLAARLVLPATAHDRIS